VNPVRVELNEDILFKPIDSVGSLLIDLNQGVYSLNQTATDLLLQASNLAEATTCKHHHRSNLNRYEKQFLAQLERIGVLRSSLRLKDLTSKALTVAIRMAVSVSFRSTFRRCFGLSLGLNVLYWSNRCLGFGRMTRIVHDICQSYGHAPSGQPSLQYGEEILAAVAKCWLRMTCKEIAMATMLRARQEGYSPKLIIGLGIYPINLHTWTEVDGQVVTDFADRCEQLVPIHSLAC